MAEEKCGTEENELSFRKLKHCRFLRRNVLKSKTFDVEARCIQSILRKTGDFEKWKTTRKWICRG